MFNFFLIPFLILTAVAAADPTGDALSAGEWRLDLRHESRYAAENSLDESLRYRHAVNSWLDADTGVRLSQTKINLASLQYKAGLIATPFDFPPTGPASASCRRRRCAAIAPSRRGSARRVSLAPVCVQSQVRGRAVRFAVIRSADLAGSKAAR